jgi:hypothetical protein
MAIHGAPRDKVIDGLRTLKPFKNSTGSMRGVEGSEGTGRLEGDALAQFRADSPRFTVYSYATPIGWVTSSGLVRNPAVKYSMTTDQHQGACRTYLNQ